MQMRIKNRKLSFKIGLFLSFVHFTFSLFVVMDIIKWSVNAQWQFMWVLPFLIDVPVSLFYLAILYFIPQNFSFDFLPYPISQVRDFILPFTFHNIIGTVWYFFVPILAAKLVNKLRNK
jgi:hypothetical protein